MTDIYTNKIILKAMSEFFHEEVTKFEFDESEFTWKIWIKKKKETKK